MQKGKKRKGKKKKSFNFINVARERYYLGLGESVASWLQRKN